MGPLLIVIGVVFFLPIVYVVLTYNTLVALRNHIRDAWGNIDTELKRRYDLIPNLVATKKGMRHMKKTSSIVSLNCARNAWPAGEPPSSRP